MIELKIELIINKRLYEKGIIDENTYLKVENNIFNKIKEVYEK